jgi:acetyltransferase-like isoleucine patch superfamily enzyme
MPDVSLLGRPPVSIDSGVRIRTAMGGRIILHGRSHVARGVELLAQASTIEIGEGTFIGPWGTITAKAGISIGAGTQIGERVSIRDQDHDIHANRGVTLLEAGFKAAPIIIGEDVWIGAGAVILRGVCLGKGAVVAANAVVTHSVGEYEVVAGVPARRIAFRGAGT